MDLWSEKVDWCEETHDTKSAVRENLKYVPKLDSMAHL